MRKTKQKHVLPKCLTVIFIWVPFSLMENTQYVCKAAFQTLRWTLFFTAKEMGMVWMS